MRRVRKNLEAHPCVDRKCPPKCSFLEKQIFLCTLESPCCDTELEWRRPKCHKEIIFLFFFLFFLFLTVDSHHQGFHKCNELLLCERSKKGLYTFCCRKCALRACLRPKTRVFVNLSAQRCDKVAIERLIFARLETGLGPCLPVTFAQMARHHCEFYSENSVLAFCCLFFFDPPPRHVECSLQFTLQENLQGPIPSCG